MKLFSSNTEVINNIEQVNIIFKWHGRNIYVQRYSQFKSGLVVEKDCISMEARPHIYT